MLSLKQQSLKEIAFNSRLSENLKRRDHLGVLDIDGRILHGFLRNRDMRVWTGLM
jgi:hypothetical protein